MKNLILILIICTLSGCGLFRRSVKTSISSEHIENVESNTEGEEKVKAVVEGESKIVSTEQKQVQKNVDENTTVTADEIEVKPDGSIKAKGGVKLEQNKRDKGNSIINKAVERKDRYIGHIETSKANKEQEKSKTVDKVKDSQLQTEPKGSMMIWLGLGALVFVIGLLLFFGFRPKKPKEENKTSG